MLGIPKGENMAEKVCLITGAAGTIGQHLVAELVAQKHKVIALGDPADTFSPDILQKKRIRVTTALPITSASFKKHDVQFCFGDIGDISFLASIFSTASANGIEIEYFFHLSANATIQKTSPFAYFPAFSATANVLEVVTAYWQSHKKQFKGFFYVAENGKKSSAKIEETINRLSENKGFPATVYKEMEKTVGAGYKGATKLSSLYRVMTPFATPIQWDTPKEDDKANIRRLIRSIRQFMEDNA